MDSSKSSQPRFELLKTNDIDASPKKRPIVNPNQSKMGLMSVIAILIVALLIVIMTIRVVLSSNKVKELNESIEVLSSSYKTNQQQTAKSQESYALFKSKYESMLETTSNLNEKLVVLRRENEALNIKQNDLKQKKEEYKHLNEGGDESLQKELEKIKQLLKKNKYYYTLHFEPNKDHNLSVRDSVILQTEKEIEFLEKISKGKIRALCYSSKRDTLDGDIFLQKCGNLAPTLALVYIDNGARFGGYTSLIWEKHHIKEDSKAFMFNLNDELLFPISGCNWAISNSNRGLPNFGYGDLKLMDDGYGRSSFPSTYGNPEDTEGTKFNKLTEGITHFSTFILEVFALNDQ